MCVEWMRRDEYKGEHRRGGSNDVKKRHKI